jgi:hypothetical protein
LGGLDSQSRFSDGQIDVPGHIPKRRDGLAHYRVLASGAPARSQTRHEIQRLIHARGMIARERSLKRRPEHQRLKPPQSASRSQRRAIRFSSLIYLLCFRFAIATPVLWRSSWIKENDWNPDLFMLQADGGATCDRAHYHETATSKLTYVLESNSLVSCDLRCGQEHH